MGHEGPQTLGLVESIHWSAILSLALSLFVALVAMLWLRGWLVGEGIRLVFATFLTLAALFGLLISMPLAIFALYQASRPSWHEGLFLAIPALLIALGTIAWLRRIVSQMPTN